MGGYCTYRPNFKSIPMRQSREQSRLGLRFCLIREHEIAEEEIVQNRTEMGCKMMQVREVDDRNGEESHKRSDGLRFGLGRRRKGRSVGLGFNV